MKLFSSFDTNYKSKLLADKKEEFGENRVHLIGRSGLFLFVKVIYPIIFSLIISGLMSWWVSYFLELSLWRSIGIAFFSFLCILLPYRVMKHYIDYHMDYCVITPSEIIRTEQTWLFKRYIRTLDITKIKSMNVQKKYIWKSIFNNWSIIFMSDGDNSFWEISLDYIHNPEQYRSLLEEFINL